MARIIIDSDSVTIDSASGGSLQLSPGVHQIAVPPIWQYYENLEEFGLSAFADARLDEYLETRRFDGH